MCNFDFFDFLDGSPAYNQVNPPVATPVVQQQAVSQVFIYSVANVFSTTVEPLYNSHAAKGKCILTVI